ncbi:MAG: hypothetical protein GWP91_18325 [Rhodobacterales bacterium]|nr:hypothetical protein [Rhodobacterales bacterium]
MYFRKPLVGLAAVVLLGLTACGGETAPAAPSAAEVAAASALHAPAERVAEAWPVLMATEEDFAPYAGKQGWISLVMKRDYRLSVEQLGPNGGADAARAHAEMAAVYRQAALLSAYALIETYGKTPVPTDPVGAAHLLSVSYAITGDLENARAQSAKLEGISDPTNPWHAPWSEWLGGDAIWPLALTELPLELSAAASGGWPEVGDLPHYRLPEQNGGSVRDMGDPGALVALALWHDQAAQIAAPEFAEVTKSYRIGYRMPVEPSLSVTAPLTMPYLFGSDYLVPGDAAFIADVTGEMGISAIEKHVDTSLLAWAAQASRVAGKMDAERAVDVLAALREDLLIRSAEVSGGEPLLHHRQFSDMAHVGAFRNLALVAEIEGDREVSGLLRINAMERSQKATACPVGLLALGAWDASNRYPSRAQDILHSHARRLPSLETARYGLDVMALRVSRERPGETPGI